jgi:hypothetical protein
MATAMPCQNSSNGPLVTGRDGFARRARLEPPLVLVPAALLVVRRAVPPLPLAPLLRFAPEPAPFLAAPSLLGDMPVSEPVFFCRVEGVRAEVAMLGRLAEDQRRGVLPRRGDA